MFLTETLSNPQWLNWLIFAVAAVAVWLAGTRLTYYLDGINTLTKLGQAFVGMLLLGTITSLPELANVLASSSSGNPRLAINNVLGSASINLVLLAVADAMIGRDAVTGLVAKPSTMIMGALSILVLTMVSIAILAGDVDVLGIGIGVWPAVIWMLCIGSFWLAGKYDNRAPWMLRSAITDLIEGTDAGEINGETLSSLIWKSAAAGAVIFIAGYSLSQTGDALAVQTGIGTGLVGFLLIGFSTSMPELSTIIACLTLRRYEMAFGQVFGTNFVNLSLILIADMVFQQGPVINELGIFEILAAQIGMLLIGVFLVGLLERRDSAIFRMGYDSLAVLILFAVGVVLLFLARPV